jgi:hypothetical protein
MGNPMPSGVTWDDAWGKMLEFRADTSAGLEGRNTGFHQAA